MGNGGSGELLGSSAVNLSNSTALVFNHSDALSYSGVIAGAGGLTQTGPGILTLLGSNTYTGGTTISAGTLQVGNGGKTGSIAGSVLDNALLALSRSDTVTFGNVISGSGGLTQTGPGTLILTASNTFSGGTTISGGSLTLGNANALQNSSLTVNTNNSLLFSGAIATFNLGGLFGAGNITLADSSALALSVGGNGANTTYSGVLSGSGGLTKTGTGILTLAGINAYSGSTTLTAGELSISASNNLSATSPIVFNGGTLQITGTAVSGLGSFSVNWPAFNGGFDIANAANVFTVGNALSGTGSLGKLGPGTLLLTASNGYSGGTTISAGKLLLSGTGTLGSGPVTDNGALVFNLSANPTYAGLISGVGQPDSGRQRSTEPYEQQHVRGQHDDFERIALVEQRQCPAEQHRDRQHQ